MILFLFPLLVGARVVFSPVSLTVWERSTAIFSCAFTGNPLPVDITWRTTRLGSSEEIIGASEGVRPFRIEVILGLITVRAII